TRGSNCDEHRRQPKWEAVSDGRPYAGVAARRAPPTFIAMSTAVVTASTPVAAPEMPATLWQIAWRQVRRNRLAMICLGIIVLYSLVAAWSEYVYWSNRLAQRTPPYKVVEFNNRFADPSLRHPLGTDSLGRDVLRQVVQGTRIAFE